MDKRFLSSIDYWFPEDALFYSSKLRNRWGRQERKNRSKISRSVAPEEWFCTREKRGPLAFCEDDT